MRVPKIDLRTPDMRPEPHRTTRVVVLFVVLFLSIGAVAFSSKVIFSEHPSFEWSTATFLGQLRALVRSADKPLAGEHDDRINILVLGMGGEGHDGPNLTDTIIVASYQPSTDKIALLSIPRDLAVNTTQFGSVKVNAVNAYAEGAQRGSGAATTAAVLSEVLGEPINYWVRVDFHGFERAIDAIGGVDVHVDRAFSDEQFPVADHDNQLKTVSFAAGTQHMDGKTALDFARSRHGSNGEGSDFARSKRQEKIMLALRQKTLSAGTLLNPFTVDQLIATVADNVKTNFETWEILRLARQASDVKASDIAMRVMSDQNALIPATGPDGAFLLVPHNGDWQAVRDFAHGVFVDAPKSVKHEVRIEIQNGTAVTGLANKTAAKLTEAGMTVVRVGNATDRAYEKSVIYDLTSGAKTADLVKIRSIVDANVAVSVPPTLALTDAGAPAPDESEIDFVLVLGKNASL